MLRYFEFGRLMAGDMFQLEGGEDTYIKVKWECYNAIRVGDRKLIWVDDTTVVKYMNKNYGKRKAIEYCMGRGDGKR